MKDKSSSRVIGVGLMFATTLAYFFRPFSCGWVLRRFSSDDDVPYADFDYHGWGVIFAMLMALLFAGPVLWLASKVFLSGSARFRLFGRAQDAKATIVSVAVALGIGAPMQTQLNYLSGLPLSLTTPVLLSSLTWLLVVEVARTTVVENDLFGKPGVRFSAALALILTVPKLALLGVALSR